MCLSEIAASRKTHSKNMLNTELFDNFGSFHLQLSLHTMIVLECGSTWCNFVFKATRIPPINNANTPIVLIYMAIGQFYIHILYHIYIYNCIELMYHCLHICVYYLKLV